MLVNNFTTPAEFRERLQRFEPNFEGDTRSEPFDHERLKTPAFVWRPTNYSVNAVFYRHRMKSFT